MYPFTRESKKGYVTFPGAKFLRADPIVSFMEVRSSLTERATCPKNDTFAPALAITVN